MTKIDAIQVSDIASKKVFYQDFNAVSGVYTMQLVNACRILHLPLNEETRLANTPNNKENMPNACRIIIPL
jgi:hypothetical protein